ncbi:MAG: hypothetical protein QXI53_03530 [Archaeoglobaceae archaeon]
MEMTSEKIVFQVVNPDEKDRGKKMLVEEKKETHSSPKRMPINRLFNRCWHFQAVALLREELSHVLEPKMRI